MGVIQSYGDRDAGSLAVKYGGALPRYTSYPTAPHFTDTVNPATYREWLAAIPGGMSLSLYLHVPFCREMCWYCGCFTKVVNRYDPVARYVDLLLREIDMVADALAREQRVGFIHWGGGSPTIMTPQDWSRTIARLHARFNIADDAEIAIEVDPRTATGDYVRALGDLGVNRVSIGVQEFDEDIQRTINRIQPFDVTERTVAWLRRAGIGNINLDLMYGLPKQSVAHVERMTHKALTLRPQRIALFGYAHVPWMKTHQRLINEQDLPGVEARYEQAARAAHILVAAGYVRVGFDHFALPGDVMAGGVEEGVTRNFQGYTTDASAALIGLGASAIGALPQGYAQNASSLQSYRAMIEEGQFATVRGVALKDEDRLRRHVIERIMCDLCVDLADACRRFGMPPDALDGAFGKMVGLIEDGLVHVDGYTVRVEEGARPLVRNVAACFDAYFGGGRGRHSSGV